MSVEENKEVVRRYVERTSKDYTEKIEELTTPNFVQHRMGTGTDYDKAGYRQHANETMASAPDLFRTIDDMIAEGNKVSVRCTLRGTDKEKPIEITSFMIYRLEDGKIAELWVLHDRYSLYQQLGTLPSTEEIGK